MASRLVDFEFTWKLIMNLASWEALRIGMFGRLLFLDGGDIDWKKRQQYLRTGHRLQN